MNGRKYLLVVSVLRFLHLSHCVDHGIEGELLELLLILLELLLRCVHVGNGVQKSFSCEGGRLCREVEGWLLLQSGGGGIGV